MHTCREGPYTAPTEKRYNVVLSTESVALPSIDEAFKHKRLVGRALTKAGFTSLRQVAMMPREALIEIPGIKVSSAAHISRTLKEQYNLHPRLFSEKLSDYLTQHYGCVEDAPLGALQIAVVRSGTINRPVFAPLELVTVLEAIDPDMTIVQLICLSRQGVRTMAIDLVESGVQIHNVDEDLRHLVSRMNSYDIVFAPQKITLPVKLYAVS